MQGQFSKISAAALLLVGVIGARGQVTQLFSFSSGASVPDDSASGWADTQPVSMSGYDRITDIKVLLNISGGFNGDLYGALTGPGGSYSVLLNRVGRTSVNAVGYENTGFNVTLSESFTYDIHTYQSHTSGLGPLDQVTGNWKPDGRPAVSYPPGVLDTDLRTKTLDSFLNQNPNGSWTLFLADLSSGGQSTVVSWGVQITAVPEPDTYAALTGIALTGFFVWKRSRRLKSLPC